MEKEELLKILSNYNVRSVNEYKEIDSTNGDDFRLNIIVDKKYVLRINNPVISEERLESISRLCERYNSIGVLAPQLHKNKDGAYLTSYGKRVCYLSDYLDYQTEDDVENECCHEQVQNEVWKSIGLLSKRYSDYDLSPVNSMWSLIDLAPLDVDVDEKQVNLDTLVNALTEIGEIDMANGVIAFNLINRNKIKGVYKQLPRCVIQGDLNGSNILVKDGHFVGLIDFNMSGTEVNVNHFCAETNGWLCDSDFADKSARQLFDDWISAQNRGLGIILKEYELNELEGSVIENYRNICLISQFPNVMAFLKFLKDDKAKALQIINLILER